MAADRRSGFMLLEVLVAAVVAVVLITLLTRLAGDNWHRVEEVRGTSGAMAVARSVLEESSARTTLEAGERRGMAGVYRWVVVTERLGEVQPMSATATATNDTEAAKEPPRPEWILYRLDVVVVAPSGRRTTLESYRLGPMRT